MTTFAEYLKEVKPVVDDKIEQVAHKKLKDEYLVQLLIRGKRLRAGLLSLAFESTCDRRFTSTLDLACAIELAHSASLIIDDMLDEDELRRGLPTVHMTEGHKRAMLDTVGILSLPYDLVVPFGESYVQSLAETQRGMVSGVLMEVINDPDMPASKVYDIIIKQKTGKPFGLAASWGYLAGLNGKKNGGNGHTGRWTAYGIHVGKAMQIADDMADLKEMLRTKKRTGFGSELLLLRCVTAERLAKELFSDIRHMDLHFEKARELWSNEGIQSSLKHMLGNELAAARASVDGLGLRESEKKEMLISAPEEIAHAMLSEKQSALRNPSQ